MNQTGNKYKQLSNIINDLNNNVKFVVENNSVKVLDYSKYDNMFGYRIVLKRDFIEYDTIYQSLSSFYDIIKDASKLLNTGIITTSLKIN